MQRCSVFTEGLKEADRFKWIESQRAGYDLGEDAIRCWVKQHWYGYLRAKWVEHLLGITFWIEVDRGDFGLLHREFLEHPLLIDRILDRLRCGYENLDLVLWAQEFHVNLSHLFHILTILDINSRRIHFEL